HERRGPRHAGRRYADRALAPLRMGLDAPPRRARRARRAGTACAHPGPDAPRAGRYARRGPRRRAGRPRLSSTERMTAMAEQQATLFSNMSGEQGFDLLEDLVAVAQSGAAFGEPLTVGERTVITAAEVSSGLGYGYGLGAGTAPGTAEAQDGPSSGYGGGGGGG